MTASPSHSGIERHRVWADAVTLSDTDALRILAIAAGITWSVLFVVIGLRYELQTYGDGAMFSYSVAVQDAWAFHWHNISGRVTVYLLSLAPAEAYVGLTGDPGGGIVIYGLLFFVMPFLGLIATFAADRSKGRIIFGYACFSTACFCPLVFGFPTEMWMAHALFWPALAVGHYAGRGVRGLTLVFAMLLALIFTHEGALVLAFAIVATLLLRGARELAFLRAAGALLAALAIWVAVKFLVPPDDYFDKVLIRAAINFFDAFILSTRLVLLIFNTIAIYGVAFLILRRLTPTKAHVWAATIIASVLAVYWLWIDQGMHAANRYYLRTVLVAVPPMFGTLAALYALRADDRLPGWMPFLPRVMTAITGRVTAQAIAGAFMLVMLVHAVETAKFVMAWAKYKAAVVALSTGVASDPALGDPHFVSSDRIGGDLNRLSWDSTTQFMSVIVANFAPTRLVVDPTSNYFWLSCETATANLNADRAVPAESRRLVRIHTCLHRK
jgi:hypothetical protein